uniref:Transmembrane protein n=1 Tax=Pseudo-nitzschia delicatissima TaxID=44447 RepID=A0A7S0UIX0_9STRA|mmetsp:Transcript_921/g.1873  ORF Transcript_921/g.1873 Transcript_921/m.1873 type:complete len:321 (+) Transcript_921:345-1307(+)
MAIPYSHGKCPLLRWVLIVATFAIFSMMTRITIEVEAWVLSPDSSGFRGQRSSFQFSSHRRTTSLPLYQKRGRMDNHRKPQSNDRQRPQSEFFFSTTAGLRYTNDDTADIVGTNETTFGESQSVSPSTEKSGSAAGTFGDIMSPTIDDADLLFQDGLVTSETYSLEACYGISNPLDRMAVTANGNLQRLFSSYYDAPVVVEMVHCKRQKPPKINSSSSVGATAMWDRRVLLKIFDDQTFCTADSVVEVHSREVEDLVESGQVGIGQLFRHFNILPEFTLLAAGPTEDGGFWRNYTLESDLVTCSIREVFCKNVWELQGEK